MNHFIYLFVLFEAPLFFSILAILGISYQGGGANSLYRIFCVACFAVSMLTFLKDYSTFRKNGKNIISFFVIFLYALIGILSGYENDSSWLSFVAFCIPSSLIAIYYASVGELHLLLKWLDAIILIISISIFFLVTQLNAAIQSGDTTYSQSLSYFAALCFIYHIFILKYGGLYKRFKLFRWNVYRIFVYVSLPLYIIAIMFSGGRGGFVTLLAGVLAFLLTMKESKWKTISYTIGLLIVALGIFSVFSQKASSGILGIFERNSERVFSYVTSSGIDMRETSGRNIVFNQSIELIGERPVLGYGLFSYKEILDEKVHQPYPHNLFLEWLIQGGVLFMLLCTCLLFKAIKKSLIIVKKRQLNYMLIPFFVYPLSKLMYTGSYMEDPFFWFSMMFVFNYKPQSADLNLKNSSSQ